MFDCLKGSSYIFEKTCPVFVFCFLICFIIFFAFSLLYYIFNPLFDSYNLDKLDEGLSNPIKNFDLLKYTNISYIADLLNITNSTKIRIVNENQEDFINNLINFTFINGNIKFKSCQKVLKIFNTIHTIFCFLKTMTFIIIFLRKKNNFIKSKIFLFLVFLMIFSIISLIFEILDFNYCSELYNSISIFVGKISQFFRIDIPKVYKDEINKIDNLMEADSLNFIISIAMIIYNICICEGKIHKKLNLKTYKDYLVNKNKVIK